MKKFILLYLLLVALAVHGQELKTHKDSVAHKRFLTLTNTLREQSYVTFFQGIGNLEPLLFEARLSPSFFLSNRQRNWALMLNPQVIVRMQRKPSFPINSPSYKVNLTYFYGLNKKVIYDHALLFASLNHHSNGEAGEYYLSDTTANTVNIDNGSFSTDFMAFGFSSFKVKSKPKNMDAFQSIKAFIEIHPKFSSTTEIQNRYGNYRFYASWAAGGPWNPADKTWLNRWMQHSGLEIQSGWIAGKMLGNSEIDARKRWVIDIKYNYYPDWFDEVAFFVRYYRGQDYYNIYFMNTIYVISFGLTSNIMNLKQTVKTLGR
ncbi:MAG: hypothetical protein DI538_07800 [Azospira oryzae]|nr:MAG: hypothetical protein DI538_07800 [Azospira oryzae]